MKKTKIKLTAIKKWVGRHRDRLIPAANILAFVVFGILLLVLTRAATPFGSIEPEKGSITGGARLESSSLASGGQAVRFGKITTGAVKDYQTNLQMIRNQTVRNKNHDNSVFKNTPLAQLPIGNDSPLLGPRSAYLNNPNGNPEQSFPIPEGGQNRTACEFSHFAYDDPLLYPNQPGKAHLHMFFGNTDVNAYSTYDTLKDSGSSTCNGGELNRSGYWVPAMIDGKGNARIPERVVVYYKGYNPGPGVIQPYKPGMANISPMPISVAEDAVGGVIGEANYKCSDNFSGYGASEGPGATVHEIPKCLGLNQGYPNGYRSVLEMEVKFWYCWPRNSTDYGNWKLWQSSGKDRGGWWFGNCDGRYGGGLQELDQYPGISYFVNYVIEPGEDTSQWYLSSDVDAKSSSSTPKLIDKRGSMHHADWWGGWNEEINKEWVTNCASYIAPNRVPSDCGFGYLSDGGPDGNSPRPGRALKYRPQYDTPGNSSHYKVPMSTLFNELCKPLGPSHSFNPNNAMTGTYCKP